VSITIRTAALVAIMAATPALASFTQYNLVVTGNLNNQSQDIEGSAFIGGNLSGGAVNVGTRLTPAASFVGTDVLTVGGMISSSGINLQAGNLRRGGSRSGFLNLNGGGPGVQFDIVDSGVSTTAASLAAQMASTSSFLAGLTPNSTAQVPSGQPGPVNFNATPGPDGIAVFNVSGAQVFGSLAQQINLNAGSASSIIINVTGNVNWNSGNMVGAWTGAFARSRVLWNFVDATNINLDRNFNGAILAPLAALTNTTAIDGSVFVASFTQRGEVHLPRYEGYIPTPGAAGLLALGGLVAARRRR
jgi:choice-of-anchor A domain-containing protein